MSFAIRKFNWLRTPSAWQQAETWRARRAAFAERSLGAADTFNAVFAKASADQSQGLAKLATAAAVKRIRAAAKAKFDAAANLKLNKTV